MPETNTTLQFNHTSIKINKNRRTLGSDQSGTLNQCLLESLLSIRKVHFTLRSKEYTSILFEKQILNHLSDFRLNSSILEICFQLSMLFQGFHVIIAHNTLPFFSHCHYHHLFREAFLDHPKPDVSCLYTLYHGISYPLWDTSFYCLLFPGDCEQFTDRACVLFIFECLMQSTGAQLL